MPLSHLSASVQTPETLQIQPSFSGEWPEIAALPDTVLKTLLRVLPSAVLCPAAYFLCISTKTFPQNWTGVMPHFLCLGKKRHREGEASCRTGWWPCNETKFWHPTQPLDGQVSPLHVATPWFRGINLLSCTRKKPQFGVQLKPQPKDCFPYMTTIHQFLLPQSFKYTYAHSWPFFGHEIWTNCSTEISYLNTPCTACLGPCL